MNKYTDELEQLRLQIEAELYMHIGPLLFGERLYSALGYPVEIFSLPNRRGRFALSRDVARWLAQERIKAKSKEGGS